MTSTPRSGARARVRAPELQGRGWLNTGGKSLTLTDLRGRVVVLDFWSFCCVNCLHVLDELRPLEEKFADSLVLVGVHSPKFEHEADASALSAAVERYAVHHPVLDDPQLRTWQAYTARAWPTLVVIDPEGYLVASMSGEGHAHGLTVLVEELLAEHSAKGTLRRPGEGDAPYVPPPPPSSALRFPGKVCGLPDGSFLVSDTAHHQLVQLEDDLVTERARFGGDGEFAEPQGVLALPREVAVRVGYDVLVADSVHHQVRGVRLADGSVVTVAGTGRQLRERSGSGPALKQDLSTPWDLAWFADRVVIAMAGVHQLWVLHLAESVADNTVAVLGGTSEEGLRDGPAHEAWFAQPSGLAVSADGSRLWVADSETSSLRSVTLEVPSGDGDAGAGLGGFVVHTHVGQGLFDFGHRDGPAEQALFQHPLGVTVLPDGSVAVSDTYNGAIRRYDPVREEVETLAAGLAEPSDAVVEVDVAGSAGDVTGSAGGVAGSAGGSAGPSAPSARLVVVESAAHRLVRVALPEQAQRVDGPARVTQRPPTALAPGAIELSVAFTPPTGQKLDDRFGDPTRLTVSSSPEGLLLEGAGAAEGLTRRLVLDSSLAEGVLHVSVQAAACDAVPPTDSDGADVDSPGGEDPMLHAACHLYQQDWGIPVRLENGADRELTLDLRGTR